MWHLLFRIQDLFESGKKTCEFGFTGKNLHLAVVTRHRIHAQCEYNEFQTCLSRGTCSGTDTIPRTRQNLPFKPPPPSLKSQVFNKHPRGLLNATPIFCNLHLPIRSPYLLLYRKRYTKENRYLDKSTIDFKY